MTGKSMDDILSMIETVIVTYDASGSKIYNGGTEVTIPVVTVEALDPTGAGDAYRAGFLLAYTRGYSLEVCGKIGSTVASFAVQSIGCQTDLPTWDVMKARYEENFGKLELPA
jgi:ribokinase